MSSRDKQYGLLALSPLMVFLCLYLVTSIVLDDFYSMPITVAFAASSVYCVAITRGISLKERINLFSKGASDSNIMLMIWIFVLAGAFAVSAKDMGAIDATVGLLLKIMPESLVPAGMFIGSCFISLSIGTSVGTIVALVPVGAAMAEAAGLNLPFITAVIVGGAFFGDNLSFISDTTIAATRTQGCDMVDKFKANVRIVLPAAIAVLLYYLFCGVTGTSVTTLEYGIDYVKIIPYIIVLVTALMGVNVMTVLVIGIITTGIIGVATGSFDGAIGWVASMGVGINGMSELIIITLMAGGMLALISYNGGIDYILRALTKRINGRRGAELSIATLVSFANICTANNTIAIITVGQISADISRRYGIEPRKSASILDTFSCVVQGIIPYGAQLLMAAGLTALSPIEIIRYLYYPMVVCVFALLGIMIKNPNRLKAK